MEKSTRLLGRLRGLYHEYPGQFWILVVGTFIDRLGGALLFPFFTLYLTRKFGIGMTQVGVIFGLFAISSFFGSMVGGALTDRLGRKSMLLFGLVMSALSSLLMGVIDALVLFFFVILIVGVLSESGGPAQQALVADLLPEEKRAQGFGILRVVVNLAVTIGPVIGGFLAARSYLLLFVSDALTSLVTAVIIFFTLRETWKPIEGDEIEEPISQTFRGYLQVVRDVALVWFLVASILMVLVYMQMNTTLAVYLRDVHDVPEQGFGYILSLNAAMVVLFQFSVTRWVNRFQPLVVMTVGTLLYAFGFTLYGLVSWYGWFLAAMVVITIGEMMVSPVSQSIVARLAPEDMRGRYMAVYGFSWLVPIAAGPLLAGVVMDYFDPNWVWYLSGLIGLVAAVTYYALGWRVGRSRLDAIGKRLNVLERLEEGEINAEQATALIGAVNEGVWAKLIPSEMDNHSQQLRIRVSERITGIMKSDLRIPIGLVNTVLYTEGGISSDLDQYGIVGIKSLIARAAAEKTPQRLDAVDDQIDVTIDENPNRTVDEN